MYIFLFSFKTRNRNNRPQDVVFLNYIFSIDFGSSSRSSDEVMRRGTPSDLGGRASPLLWPKHPSDWQGTMLAAERARIMRKRTCRRARAYSLLCFSVFACSNAAGGQSCKATARDKLGFSSDGRLLLGTKVGSESAGENPVASALLEVLG